MIGNSSDEAKAEAKIRAVAFKDRLDKVMTAHKVIGVRIDKYDYIVTLDTGVEVVLSK